MKKAAENRVYARFLKRTLDFLLAAILMLLFSPLYAVLALTVRLKIGSPVLFRQQRPGLMEKPFILYKFRTMTDAADSEGKLLPDSDRITGLGRFLRSTSLDELPELWNILKGEMSFVGPRPLMMQYLPYYTEEERMRHHVRPGLTGLAQVRGRNSLNWEQRFAWDLEYVRNLSFRLDIRILLETVRVVFSREHIDFAPPGTEYKPLDVERANTDKI